MGAGGSAPPLRSSFPGKTEKEDPSPELWLCCFMPQQPRGARSICCRLGRFAACVRQESPPSQRQPVPGRRQSVAWLSWRRLLPRGRRGGGEEGGGGCLLSPFTPLCLMVLVDISMLPVQHFNY